jgi:hypothetical protein
VVVGKAAEGVQVGHDLGRIAMRQPGGDEAAHGVDEAPLGVGGGMREHGIGELVPLAALSQFAQLGFHDVHGLVPADAHELALAAFSHALQGVLQAFLRVERGDARHALDAHLAARARIALHLSDHAVFHAGKNGAFRLALVANRGNPFAFAHVACLRSGCEWPAGPLRMPGSSPEQSGRERKRFPKQAGKNATRVFF